MHFNFEDLIFVHHAAKLVFLLLEFSDPFVIEYWPVDVDRYLDLYRYLHLNFLLYFDWSVNIDWFINIYRFVNDNWILVDRFLNKSLFLDDFRHFDFFYYHLWYFLLDLYVFRNLNYLLNNSFRSRNIFGNLNPHLNRSLNNQLFLLRYNSIIKVSFPFQYIIFHLNFIQVTLQLINHLLMFPTWHISTTEMVQLQLQPNPLFLTLSELLC